VLEEAMSNFHRYFFIMPTLARFELEIHERVERGEALSADSLIALMADLFDEGYGSEVVIDRDRGRELPGRSSPTTSTRISTFSSTRRGSVLPTRWRAGPRRRRRGCCQLPGFLQAGGSMYPLDALNLAGVDMNSPDPVEAAFAYSKATSTVWRS
jgi:oligoendopeptidase F